ncbi:General stress protein 16U [compost metagenome]
MPVDVEKIAFTITIYEAEHRNQNFGQVSRSYVRIVNEVNNEELIRFDLGEDFSIETGVVVGELYRHAGEWKFSAIGSGYKDGLAGLTRDYGLQ